MQKIVINAKHGGFSLSDKAVRAYAERKGIKLYTDDFHGLTMYYTVPPGQYHELSDACYARDGHYKEINDTGWSFSCRDIPRDCADLIAVVGELGDDANGRCAKLQVIEIPDDVDWKIEEYDGLEWVAEKHRTWS